jgi:hypothetical protein
VSSINLYRHEIKRLRREADSLVKRMHKDRQRYLCRIAKMKKVIKEALECQNGLGPLCVGCRKDLEKAILDRRKSINPHLDI